MYFWVAGFTLFLIVLVSLVPKMPDGFPFREWFKTLPLDLRVEMLRAFDYAKPHGLATMAGAAAVWPVTYVYVMFRAIMEPTH